MFGQFPSLLNQKRNVQDTTKLYSSARLVDQVFKIDGALVINNTNVFSNENVHLKNLTFTDNNNNSGHYGSILTTNPLTYKSLWSYQGSEYKGSNMLPYNHIEYQDVSMTGGTNPHRGGVLAPNGKLYYAPSDSSNVFVYDPYTKTYEEIKTEIESLSNNYRSCVCSHKGLIYSIPYEASDILVINPYKNEIEKTISDETLLTSENKWKSGVLAPNHKIYCAPDSRTNAILVIDTETDDVSSIDITDMSSGFVGSVLGQDGNIYFIPHESTKVLYVDYDTEDISTIDISNDISDNKWYGGALASNGKIYCAPSDSDYDYILTIDTTTTPPELDYIDISEISGDYTASVYAPNGNIYMGSFNTEKILVLNTSNNDYEILDLDIGVEHNIWSMILGPDLKLYALDNDPGQNQMISIKTGIPKEPLWMLAPEFNKF